MSTKRRFVAARRPKILLPGLCVPLACGPPVHVEHTEQIGVRASMNSSARPSVGIWVRCQARPHRIQFDVGQHATDGCRVDRARVEPVLPKVARTIQFGVRVLGEAAVNVTQRA